MDSSQMEITVWPSFQHITWKVRNFFQLPQESDSFLDSPDFPFAGARYCMRLYPGVRSKGGNVTQFHVRRLTFCFADGEVDCQIGLRRKDVDGDESYDYVRSSLEQNRVYERSSIENNSDEYVADGSLTLVCDIWPKSRAESSAPGEEEQRGFPGHNDSFSTRWSSAKMELTTESLCKRVYVTVPQFLEMPREEVDSLASPKFRFAGDTFCLQFGRNADTGDTDLRLARLTSTCTERRVFYRVGHWYFRVLFYPYSSRSLVGTSGFCVSRSELEEQREKYVWDGTLRVVLFLHLGEESSAGAGISDAAQERGRLIGFHKLQADYGQLLQNGTESDACVVVRGKEFRVHRAVLRARSTVFEAMFGHDTAEKESGRVVIDDLDPDDFLQFLEYLYTGDVGGGLSNDNAFGLYMAADKYDVAILKSDCVEHMRANLSVDSFCDVVTLALRHCKEELLTEASRFFKDNIQDIVVTAKWQRFNIENGASVNEFLIKAFVSESTS